MVKQLISIPNSTMEIQYYMRIWTNTNGKDDVFIDFKKSGSNIYQLIDNKVLKKLADKVLIKSKELDSELIFDGFVPDKLLYIDLETKSELMWYVPKSKRMLKFLSRGINKEALLELPTTIFHVKNKELRVYYTKSIKGKETALWPSNYMNVNDNNSVCLGNKVDVNTNDIGKFMAYWEELFFKSPFTHNSKSNWIYKNSKKVTFKTNSEAWEYFVKKGKIDIDLIKPLKYKIKDLV